MQQPVVRREGGHTLGVSRLRPRRHFILILWLQLSFHTRLRSQSTIFTPILIKVGIPYPNYDRGWHSIWQLWLQLILHTQLWPMSTLHTLTSIAVDIVLSNFDRGRYCIYWIWPLFILHIQTSTAVDIAYLDLDHSWCSIPQHRLWSTLHNSTLTAIEIA